MWAERDRILIIFLLLLPPAPIIVCASWRRLAELAPSRLARTRTKTHRCVTFHLIYAPLLGMTALTEGTPKNRLDMVVNWFFRPYKTKWVTTDNQCDGIICNRLLIVVCHHYERTLLLLSHLRSCCSSLSSIYYSSYYYETCVIEKVIYDIYHPARVEPPISQRFMSIIREPPVPQDAI